jgi:hypothetical protein
MVLTTSLRNIPKSLNDDTRPGVSYTCQRRRPSLRAGRFQLLRSAPDVPARAWPGQRAYPDEVLAALVDTVDQGSQPGRTSPAS